ncbi:hypothetical protein OEZ86_000342 [Tetradesmus obliquus]|nr:hypothetical protein OEZ86_000342 [Tetradesmus obliquus]
MTETVFAADVPQQAASAGLRKPSAGWKKVQQGVLKPVPPDDADSFVGDKVLNVPSIIAQHSVPAAVPATTPPRLAIMIHGVRNLPLPAGSSSSSSSSQLRMYAKAAVHLPGQLPASSSKAKTHPTRVVQQGAVWNSLLQLSPEQPQQMVLSISLKHKQLLTNTSVVWGVASLPLSEVVACPGTWGERQQLQLHGHRLAGKGATLEVQLFLSTEHISGPLSVLAATWNVGNALPPPVEQLREQWLRGAAESQHHLVVVGAQECNYTKDARMSRRCSNRQERTASSSPTHNGIAEEAAAEAKAAADTGVAGVAAAETLGSQVESPGLQGGAPEGPSGVLGGSDGAADDAVAGSSDDDDAHAMGAAHGTSGRQQQQRVLPAVAITASGRSSSQGGALSPTAGAAAAAAAAAAESEAEVQRASSAQSKTAALRSYLFEQVDSAAAWERHIAAALGSKYWLVQVKHMFQTRILLFARVDVVPYISSISAAFEATGIGHVGLNKGGAAVSLKLDDTHLAFVASHLAAHQSKTQQRNADVAEIAANLKLLPQAQRQRGAVHKPDVGTGFHHLVWLGDLNYRLDWGQQAETHADSPTPEDFASLCAAISSRQWPQLLALDQLRQEQAAGRVFAGFSEGKIDFAPTFKVLKGEPGSIYGLKRSPAWCDRVLLKSALPHKRGSCSSYFAAPDICTSDHKPVGAVLSLPLITDTVTSGRTSARTPFKLYVASLKLEGEATWRRLAELAAHTGQAAAAAAGGQGPEGQAAPQQQVKHKALKLQLVLSGACIAGKHQHFLRVDNEAVLSGLAAVGASSRAAPPDPAAAVTASLTLREENLPLLPGSAADLQDDWLLLQLVVVEGFKHRTIARGVVPLQPAVAEYNTRTFKAVEVPVQLECNTAAAGSAVISLQLISSSSARQGMYEAIRRMRTLAMSRHMTSLSATESRRHAGIGGSGGRSMLDRTMSGTLLRLGHKVVEGMGWRGGAGRQPGLPVSP